MYGTEINFIRALVTEEARKTMGLSHFRKKYKRIPNSERLVKNR
jgi:hypothetical protein